MSGCALTINGNALSGIGYGHVTTRNVADDADRPEDRHTTDTYLAYSGLSAVGDEVTVGMETRARSKAATLFLRVAMTLRIMAHIAVYAFRHPLTEGVVDLETGEVYPRANAKA